MRAWVPSHVRFQPRSDYMLRLRADNLIDELAVFEDQERRDAANVELRGGARILVNIQFRDLVSTIRFGSQLIENRREHATWSTPFGPRINQDWPR